MYKTWGTTVGYVTLALIFFVASGVVVWVQSHAAATSTSSAIDRSINKLHAEIGQKPNQSKLYLALAAAYMQKIRETADSSYYATIDTTLDAAARVDPTNAHINALRASVENGRHHFKKGRELIVKAIAQDPHVADFYGIEADSEIELGMYSEAERTLQTMSDLKPNYSAFTRIAYLRELTGDTEGAEDALKSAIGAGSTYTENVAWAYVELGILQMRSSLSDAKMSFATAFQIEPQYAPALEGQGKIAFAEGNAADALADFNQAFAVHPLAQYAIDLGDVYSAQGDTAKAAQQYALARVAFEKTAASGVSTDLEYSLFLSDHGDTALALQKAKQALSDRPSIYGADAYAWALYKNNRAPEATPYVKLALRLGQHDPLIVFHAGMIAQATGESALARTYFKKAESLSPHFSIVYAAELKKQLAQ